MAAPDLERWIERQRRLSAERLLTCVSATGLARPGPRPGQVMRPARGSVLAAAQPVPGPGEPDYFFHWLRDAAIVLDALLVLWRAGRLPATAAGCFADSVRFDLALGRQDGRALAREPAWPPALLPELAPYLRPRAELAAAHGSALGAEARFAPDGSLDLLRWGRPQHDGPALRALTTLRLLEAGVLAEPRDRLRAERLLDRDLAFCLARHRVPCFDPWEEEPGHHFFTRLALQEALARGAERASSPRRARGWLAAATELRDALASHWSEHDGFYRSRLPGPAVDESKALDSATLLAALRAGPPEGDFSVRDPRVAATVGRLEALFAERLPINAGRAPADGLALGRYAGDRYLGGGVFLPCAFALAEYRYRRGELALGDAVLEFLAGFLPESGALPEQLDRATGASRSAADLAWSHAAFVTAVDSRDRAC
jgi:glucoamylase